MLFATCILLKNEKNIGALQLEKGLVRTNIQKTGNDVSKYLEELLSAEKKAQDAKICLHSKKEVPKPVYLDMIGNAKQSKEFEMMI